MKIPDNLLDRIKHLLSVDGHITIMKNSNNGYCIDAITIWNRYPENYPYGDTATEYNDKYVIMDINMSDKKRSEYIFNTDEKDFIDFNAAVKAVFDMVNTNGYKITDSIYKLEDYDEYFYDEEETDSNSD